MGVEDGTTCVSLPPGSWRLDPVYHIALLESHRTLLIPPACQFFLVINLSCLFSRTPLVSLVCSGARITA